MTPERWIATVRVVAGAIALAVGVVLVVMNWLVAYAWWTKRKHSSGAPVVSALFAISGAYLVTRSPLRHASWLVCVLDPQNAFLLGSVARRVRERRMR